LDHRRAWSVCNEGVVVGRSKGPCSSCGPFLPPVSTPRNVPQLRAPRPPSPLLRPHCHFRDRTCTPAMRSFATQVLTGVAGSRWKKVDSSDAVSSGCPGARVRSSIFVMQPKEVPEVNTLRATALRPSRRMLPTEARPWWCRHAGRGWRAQAQLGGGGMKKQPDTPVNEAMTAKQGAAWRTAPATTQQPPRRPRHAPSLATHLPHRRPRPQGSRLPSGWHHKCLIQGLQAPRLCRFKGRQLHQLPALTGVSGDILEAQVFAAAAKAGGCFWAKALEHRV
jgi:hypothetical protein